MRVTAALTAALALLSIGAAGQTSVTQKKDSMLERYNRTMAAQNEALIAIGVRKPEKCRSAERAIKFYRSKVWGYQDALKFARSPTYYPERKPGACAYKRFVVSSWRGQAAEYRKAYEKWVYEYAWWKWLPSKWQRIAHCETAKGHYFPGDWKHNSGTYQGAFGFYYGTWDQYKPRGAPSEAYLATPRQQYLAALNVYAAHGYSAWGCGGA